MKILLLSGLFAAMPFSASLSFAADGVLTVRAKDTTVKLRPREAARHQVTLPALELALVASFECPEGGEAASLTVSVSDTHRYYASDLLADAASLEASLIVPAGQLAPISIPGFCVLGEATDGSGLPLPGIATAQASLRCRGGNDATSVHFESVSVPVRLYCLDDAEPADSSSLDK